MFPSDPNFQDFLAALQQAKEAGNGPSDIGYTLNYLLYSMPPADKTRARQYLQDYFASAEVQEAAQLAGWLLHAPTMAPEWPELATILWAAGRGPHVLRDMFCPPFGQSVQENLDALQKFGTTSSRWAGAANQLMHHIAEVEQIKTAPLKSSTPEEQAAEVLERLEAYTQATAYSAALTPQFRHLLQSLGPEAKKVLLGLMLQRASEETSQNLTDIERFQIFAVIHFFAPEFADLQQWQRIDQLIAQYGPRALLHESPWNAESRQSRITKATLDFQDRLIGRAVAGEIDSTALIYVRLSSYGQAFESLAVRPELNPGEAWSDAFLARLDALPAAERAPWLALAAFARSASAGKPTAKWLKEAQKHVNAVGAAKFREVLTASLPLLSRPRTVALQPAQYGPDANLVLDSFNALSLKGLLWMVPLVADSALTRTLSGVVESALKKVPGVGPREPKVANAAVYALGQIDSELALSALARLNTTVTFKGTLKEVQKALAVVSQRLNISPDELLDMGVPTLGLPSVGQRVEVLGDAEAHLTVDASGTHLTFSKGGKILKSVPAAVKKDFAEELKELKAAQKEAEQVVSALSQRLDGLMIQPRKWRGEQWQERYLNHPLAGTVARRLIWLLDSVPVFWNGDELQNVNGHPLELHSDSEVQLWHPVTQPVEEVLAWRDRLEELQVRQPFKQAWREVYVLTDAERRTNTYSNRFAGHVLKQHQFNQLAALRGWRNKLRLMVDDSYPPAMRDLPAYGLRAEYWIEGIGQDYSTDSTESGTYLRVTTDQVRFYPIDAPENHAHAGGGGYSMWVNQTQQPVNPLVLADIPPLVLSEILRDVDLFVGVASVGNDPTWQDGGPGGRFREYWHSYSFGELNETAKTRAEYLKRLIPRLNIKDRLELDGKFLRVRGDVRAYKIHLGSSNILMEPNDQYLCIVPDRSSPDGKNDGPDVNFDGDRVLSLVLSKAFLLADDTGITDPVILQQLKR